MGSLLSRLVLEATLIKNRAFAEGRANDSSLFQWGIVGTGYMAEQFARYLGRSEGMNVRAIHSRSQERGSAFARRHGAIHAYHDMDEMLEREAGKVDVVYVATPVFSHYEITKRLLKAGCNVLCEKPLCENVVQARELFAIAEANSARLFEGMWTLCLPTIRCAKAWVSEGRIGDIVRVEASIRKGSQGGEPGSLYDFGAYPIAFAVSFLGDGPLSVMADRELDANGADRKWDVSILDKAGGRADIHLSNLSSGDSSAVIIGERGSIRIPSQFNRAAEVELRDVSGRLLDAKAYRYVLDGFEHEIADVAGAVKRGMESRLLKENTLVATEVMTKLSTGQYEPLGYEVASS